VGLLRATREFVSEALVQTEVNQISSRSPHLLWSIRSRPYVYGTVCRALRHVAAAAERNLYRRERHLFPMNELETKCCRELGNQGFTVLHAFFNVDLIQEIYQKTDRLFRELKLHFHDAYSVQNCFKV
jgi:hypothetical protein